MQANFTKMAVEVGTENLLLSGRFVRTHADLDFLGIERKCYIFFWFDKVFFA